MNGFRVYDHNEEEFIDDDSFCVNQEGELGVYVNREDEFGIYSRTRFFQKAEDRYELSWATRWSDRSGDTVYQGDILKRVRDTLAERDRERLGSDQPPDREDLVDVEAWIKSKKGAVGVVEEVPSGFTIKQRIGPRRAFYGADGGRTFDWSKEVEIVGNIWQSEIDDHWDKPK